MLTNVLNTILRPNELIDDHPPILDEQPITGHSESAERSALSGGAPDHTGADGSSALFDGVFANNYFAGCGAWRSELKMSTAINQLPSDCLRRTSTYLPESLAGPGAPGGTIVIV